MIFSDLNGQNANAVLMAGKLKLMSHPERLAMLCRMDKGEVSVGALVELTGLSQSAVSQHLALLRAEGVVSCRTLAKNRLYSLSDPIVRGVIDALYKLCRGDCG